MAGKTTSVTVALDAYCWMDPDKGHQVAYKGDLVQVSQEDLLRGTALGAFVGTELPPEAPLVPIVAVSDMGMTNPASVNAQAAASVVDVPPVPAEEVVA